MAVLGTTVLDDDVRALDDVEIGGVDISDHSLRLSEFETPKLRTNRIKNAWLRQLANRWP
jgi:hypothetical protein